MVREGRTEVIESIHMLAKHEFAYRQGSSGLVRATGIPGGAKLTVEDDRQDDGAIRFITMGSSNNAMVVLVWTPRDNAYRIISTRDANEREQKLHGSGV